MPDLYDTEFPALQSEYKAVFGELTFNAIGVPDDKVDYLLAEMKKAIAGKRGAITDDELDSDVPDGADL